MSDDPTKHNYDTKDYIVKESPDKVTELRTEIKNLTTKLDKVKYVLNMVRDGDMEYRHEMDMIEKALTELEDK